MHVSFGWPHSPRLAVFLARLRKAKPVSGVVFEDGFDAVRSFGGFGNKIGRAHV